MSHVTLILGIENRFRVRFTQQELLSFRKVGDLSADEVALRCEQPARWLEDLVAQRRVVARIQMAALSGASGFTRCMFLPTTLTGALRSR